MRSSRTQSDHPPTPGTIAEDLGKPSVADFDARNPFWSSRGIYIESAGSWGSISADVVRRPVGTVMWRSDHHRVAVALTAHAGVAYVDVDGGSGQAARFSPGELSFTPAGASVRTIFPAVRVIYTLQSPKTYDAICSELVRGGTIDFKTRYPISDPVVSQIVSTITRETERRFLNHIFVDALNTALAVRMVRHFVDPSKIAPPPSNGLSRERLQRVRDYIEAHLGDRLTLADLAGVACLSPYHFSRSFKLALGIGPQRYVAQRRLNRQDADAQDQSTSRLGRTGGWFLRPEPSDLRLSPRDRCDPRPISGYQVSRIDARELKALSWARWYGVCARDPRPINAVRNRVRNSCRMIISAAAEDPSPAWADITIDGSEWPAVGRSYSSIR